MSSPPLPLLASLLASPGLLQGSCSSEPQATEQSTAQEQDLRLHSEVLALPPAEATQALEAVAQIQDPIIRQAAAYAWVYEHGRAIQPAEGCQLCAELDGRHQHVCERLLSPPFLVTDTCPDIPG